MEGSNNQTDFQDKETTFFSFESVAPCDMNNPDKNYFSDKLREIDSPYFSFENFKIFSRKIKEKAFPRSLSKNNDKLKEFQPSLNVSFNVVVVTETWFNETANKTSLPEIPNYSALHKTRKNRKGGGICLHIHENLKFNVRDDMIYLMNRWKHCLLKF